MVGKTRNKNGQFIKGHKIGLGNKYREGISPWNKGLNKKILPTLSGGRPFGSKDKKKRDNTNYVLLVKRGKDHHSYGKTPSNYKGDRVSYSGLHKWVASKLGRPQFCEYCGSRDRGSRKYHWANISRKYKRMLSDWIRLCGKCHRNYDLGKIKI